MSKIKMIVNHKLATAFLQRYSDFLMFVCAEYVESISEEEILAGLAIAREIYIRDRSIFDDFLNADNRNVEIIDDAIRSLDISHWVYLKDTPKHSLLINVEGEYACAVKGLTSPMKAMCGGTGFHLRAGIILLNDHFVCDGIVQEAAEKLDTHQKNAYYKIFNDIKGKKRFYKRPSQVNN